jgi:hypothetical protein
MIMKTKLNLFHARCICAVALGIGPSCGLPAAAGNSAGPAAARTTQEARLVTSSPTIPWSQIGAKAGADYRGEGLAVSPTADGARLRCVFQRLEGEATREGLWLSSTVTNGVKDRFRIVAAEVGRQVGDVERGASERQSVVQSLHAATLHALPDAGTVSLDGQSVRFTRPGLVEEYSVSMDGVRQDFIIEHPPINPQLPVLRSPPGEGGSTLNQRPGELAVRLAVSGARVEPSAGGAQLVLDNSGRKIAYSRLRVTDATGKELTARMEVLKSNLESRKQKAEMGALVVVVNDADAVYPVRIDPTFSDANWISMGGIAGANPQVNAAVVDGSGNLYIGGGFTFVGDVVAIFIAKWDGSSWTSLGSGMDGGLDALAVSGGDVYAGGAFTFAGGSSANRIAKWNGSSWSALGSGIGTGPADLVLALAVSGSDLYAGGAFTTAGGSAATNIAKWNGSGWSAPGSGVNGGVWALAVSGSDLYVGGNFTTAGGSAANRIAKWDGTSWSALGSGIGIGPTDQVLALAVSGSNVYAGGWFTNAGGSAANYIARWDGSNWTVLGSGMGGNSYPYVFALAVSGSELYAGGQFTNAGGSAANYIAKWNGSSWSALGSGVDNSVHALVVSGSDLYAGGAFTRAGGKVSACLARAIVNPPVLAIAGDGFGGYFLHFEGVPGSTYRLQRAPGVSGPWATSSPQTAPASGYLEFWDLFPPPGQGFYRSVGP